MYVIGSRILPHTLRPGGETHLQSVHLMAVWFCLCLWFKLQQGLDVYHLITSTIQYVAGCKVMAVIAVACIYCTGSARELRLLMHAPAQSWHQTLRNPAASVLQDSSVRVTQYTAMLW